MRYRTATEPVFRITDAGPGLLQDVRDRQRRYIISMSLRTLCFLGAVVADGWLRWVLIAGAVGLPYFAVILANGARRGAEPLPLLPRQTNVPALGPGRPDAGSGSR